MQDLGTITPSLEEFRARAAGTRVIPVHIKILADSNPPKSPQKANPQPGTVTPSSARPPARPSPPLTAQSTGRDAPPPAHPSMATP